jgi:hypothetical protein
VRTRHEVRMTSRRTIAAKLPGICCICLFLIGCESEVERYKPEPNVHCVLRTNESTVTLLAGMTVGYYDSVPDTSQWLGVSDVAVSIGHRGKLTELSEIADSAGYYRTDSLPLAPGDSYSLTATYPSGARVTGSTVVPDKFGFDSLRVDTVLDVPWPGDTYARINVAVCWRESRGAGGYREQMDIWYRSGEDSSLQRYGPTFSSARHDSWTFDPRYYYWDTLTQAVDSLPLDRVRIEVKAVDRNYYDYVFSMDYMGGVDPDKMHLDGGVGVFGSACFIDSTLSFQPRGLPRGDLPSVTLYSAWPHRRLRGSSSPKPQVSGREP